jgi:hypothetical protein
MTLRPQYSLGHSEFNDFLFASVGEETNGMQLTVLSALSRLGFDPWGEAARLSDLPEGAAAGALAAAIAGLPAGNWKVSDCCAIAARLVNHLPRRREQSAQSLQEASGRNQIARSVAAKLLVCMALAAAALLIIGYLQANHGPAPDRGAVSSLQRKL